MLSPVYIGIIAIASDVVFTTVLSIWMRPHVDKNRDGAIEFDEVTRISDAPHDVVPVGQSLFDIATVPLITVLLNAWEFAFAYGLMAVLTCNLLLPATSDLSWIAAVWITFLSLIFMCAFCNNGIHVATSHMVHFVYYLCGFIPMAIFKANPPKQDIWILVAVIVARLAIFVAMKLYVWPKYPPFYKLDPMFTRDPKDGSLIPFSTPEMVASDPALAQRFNEISNLKRSRWNDWTDIHIPFPTYEILNMNVSSWFTGGAVVSWIVYGVVVKAIGNVSDVVLFGIVAGVAIVFVAVFVWWIPRKSEVSKWITLTHYYPRTTATLCFFAGAALLSTQLVVAGEGDGAALVVVIIAHVFHFIGMGLYAFAYAAVVRYFGFAKSFKRLFSFVGGHGGLIIAKQGGRVFV
ncbi:UNVERIFIED_CONTAM: hypothetical protein HDU68_006312 [Siphonaria sp. JEL0065]|nr:hypothetical protein HDU68_006312 [Siphonaria sp. JEL0065]